MLSVFKSQILYEAFSDLPYKVPNFSNVCKAGGRISPHVPPNSPCPREKGHQFSPSYLSSLQQQLFIGHPVLCHGYANRGLVGKADNI